MEVWTPFNDKRGYSHTFDLLYSSFADPLDCADPQVENYCARV